jgi:hypothetical protein
MQKSKLNYIQMRAKKIQGAQLLFSRAICGASKFKYIGIKFVASNEHANFMFF